MAKCPYCENDMKSGFLEGDGRQSLIWVEENKKRNILKNINDDACIVLGKSNLFHKARAASNYCDVCKKVIIDVK